MSSNIGANYAGMAPADLNFMYGLGGKERAYDQQRQDFNRANQNLTTTTALAPYSYGQNFLTGSPSASMYGSFTQAPSGAPNPFLFHTKVLKLQQQPQLARREVGRLLIHQLKTLVLNHCSTDHHNQYFQLRL